MLIEALEYLRTACPWHVRRMGYLSEAIATKARYRRCRDAWGSHLTATRQFILESAALTARKRSVLVLGCGHLLDIPLKELSRQFTQVICTDIVLPRQAAQQLQQHGAEFRQADITGITTACYANPHILPETASPPELFLKIPEIDMVISANIASQLPLLPIRWLAKSGSITHTRLLQLRQSILQAHLDYLQRFNALRCLITDSQIEHYHLDGRQEIDRLWKGMMLPPTQQEWLWEIAPPPEISPDTGVRHHIRAMRW